MSKEQNRLYAASPYFVSTRTHFKFINRFISWLVRLSSLFARFVTSFSSAIPFWGNFITLLDSILDSLAFGTNQNNPPISRTLAFLGYGTLTLLTLVGFLFQPIASLSLLSSLSIMLGLYFEAITIVNWFENYKKLEYKQLHGLSFTQKDYDNALMMVNASVITFASIAFKGFSLYLTHIMPTTAMILFIVAQVTEISAMIGSLGKEKVNISQNITTLEEQGLLDFTSSDNKLNKLLSETLELSSKSTEVSSKKEEGRALSKQRVREMLETPSQDSTRFFKAAATSPASNNFIDARVSPSQWYSYAATNPFILSNEAAKPTTTTEVELTSYTF